MDARDTSHRFSRRALVGGAAAGAAGLAFTHWHDRAMASSPARQTPGGRLVYGLGFDLDGTLDPQVTNFDSTIRVTMNICEPLVWMPAADQFVPGLAERWEVSEDGASYTFYLKQGVTFHDGTPFNAEAVKFTFDRVIANRLQQAGTPAAEPDIVILSGQARDHLGPYTGSEIIDDYTIKVNLESAFTPFLSGINGYLGIVSPTAVRTMGIEAFARAPVGTGPYKFGEWVENDHVTLVKNPDYNWGSSFFANTGAPYLDEIEYRIVTDVSVRTGTITTGEMQYIDAIDPLQLADLEANSEVEVLRYDQPGSGRIILLRQDREGPISDVNVRLAMHHAIDKAAFNESVYGGLNLPAASPLMKATQGYDPTTETMFQYDVARANQLLDEAGWVMGDDNVRAKDGQRLSLYWPTQQREPDISSATFLQGAWAEVGIEVNVDVLEAAVLRTVIREDINYDITPLWFSYADPDVLRTVFWSGNIGNFNRSRLNDPEVDEWLIAAYQASDPAERAALYAQVQQKVLNIGATIPLVDTVVYNAKRANVQGDAIDYAASYVWLNSTSIN
jgi:peptide/nickel transport system substrate-binding protein